MCAKLRIFLVLLLTTLCFAELEQCSANSGFSQEEWQFESNARMSSGVRAIVKKLLSVEQAEGVGARVRRSVGRSEVGCSALPSTRGFPAPSSTHFLLDNSIHFLHQSSLPTYCGYSYKHF